MSDIDTKEAAEHLRKLSEFLNIKPEVLLAAGNNQSTVPVISDDEFIGQEPARIVYPNVKFPKYVYREYPKLYYRGIIIDIEEPFVMLKDGQQINAIRVVRDQFRYETLEVRNKNEEALNTRGWFKTYVEAKEYALAHRDENVVSPHGMGVSIKEPSREAPTEPPVQARKGPRRAA